jgi:transposase
MGNLAGVKRDFRALERRRLRAARLLQQGCSAAEVARKVGVHRQSVSRWVQRLAAGGREALRKAARAGRKPRLSEADRRRIITGLKRGPEALGYETGLWTSWRVADLIERECGVRYTNVHVWRILRELGWSCQRPVGRALERNEKAVHRWKRVRWPEVKKTPKNKGASSFSSTNRD